MRVYEGGCLCGAVRYRSTSEPYRSTYCHCDQCKKWTGAPAIVGAQFALDGFEITGELGSFRSSGNAVRQFCPRCGSPLFWRADATPDRLSLFVGTLDDPSLAPPTAHIFASGQVGWCRIEDDLPRYVEGFDSERTQ